MSSTQSDAPPAAKTAKLNAHTLNPAAAAEDEVLAVAIAHNPHLPTHPAPVPAVQPVIVVAEIPPPLTSSPVPAATAAVLKAQGIVFNSSKNVPVTMAAIASACSDVQPYVMQDPARQLKAVHDSLTGHGLLTRPIAPSVDPLLAAPGIDLCIFHELHETVQGRKNGVAIAARAEVEVARPCLLVLGEGQMAQDQPAPYFDFAKKAVPYAVPPALLTWSSAQWTKEAEKMVIGSLPIWSSQASADLLKSRTSTPTPPSNIMAMLSHGMARMVESVFLGAGGAVFNGIPAYAGFVQTINLVGAPAPGFRVNSCRQDKFLSDMQERDTLRIYAPSTATDELVNALTLMASDTSVIDRRLDLVSQAPPLPQRYRLPFFAQDWCNFGTGTSPAPAKMPRTVFTYIQLRGPVEHRSRTLGAGQHRPTQWFPLCCLSPLTSPAPTLGTPPCS